MQLFALGVVKLEADGTLRRGELGTFTQRDVERPARVFTGWPFDPDPPIRTAFNWGNWGKPMVPSRTAAERDSGAKLVLDRSFPAGQSAESATPTFGVMP